MYCTAYPRGVSPKAALTTPNHDSNQFWTVHQLHRYDLSGTLKVRAAESERAMGQWGNKEEKKVAVWCESASADETFDVFVFLFRFLPKNSLRAATIYRAVENRIRAPVYLVSLAGTN